MEISSHYPYYPAKLTQEPEGQGVTPHSIGQKNETINPPDAATQEKIDLVRSQNQVSPLPETVDLSQAADLLYQVQAEMSGWGKAEVQGLYQYERLRELLYRVSQPLEA